MTEPPSRDEVIELLEKLGSDRDEDVLEAARELHARIGAAGTTWEELLVPEGGGVGGGVDGGADDTADAADAADYDAESPDPEDDPPDPEDDPPDPEDDPPDPEDDPPGPSDKASGKNAETIALIDQLLAKSHVSSDMREELEGYKIDIAEGEFEERDRRYIRAVHKRLSKRR